MTTPMKGRTQIVASSVNRVLCLAEHVWREGVRQRLLYGFALVYLLFLALAGHLRALHFGPETDGFVLHLGLAAASLFGSVFTVLCTVAFFMGEFESRTVLTLFTKPVGRFEYILGKWLGISAVLGAFCLSAVVVLAFHVSFFGGASSTDAAGQIAMQSLLAAGVLEWLKCSVLAASVLLVAVVLRGQLLALAVGFVVLLLGHVRPMIDEALRGIGHPVLRAGAGGLSLLVPDFRMFATAGEGRGVPGGLLSSDSMADAVAYAGCYLVGALLAAAVVFCRREV